jgi:curli biogenesis system outer membrane secretion channel CsgG
MRVRQFLGLATVFVAAVAMSGSAHAAQGSKRPSVAVMDFDYGAVNNWWSGVWGNYDIGKGMADQVVDELVNDGSFRVIERKKLDTILAEQDFAQSDRADPSAAKLAKVGKVLGVKYIISGSITKFASSDKKYGAGGLGGGMIGGLGLKKAKSEVTITLRMIDATTGEIMLSAKGEGVSTKGGGLSVGGLGHGGGAGFSMGSSEYKASALGEAQEQACKLVVQQMIAKKDRLE